jgi:hypothetical protein
MKRTNLDLARRLTLTKETLRLMRVIEILNIEDLRRIGGGTAPSEEAPCSLKGRCGPPA